MIIQQTPLKTEKSPYIPVLREQPTTDDLKSTEVVEEVKHPFKGKLFDVLA